MNYKNKKNTLKKFKSKLKTINENYSYNSFDNNLNDYNQYSFKFIFKNIINTFKYLLNHYKIY